MRIFTVIITVVGNARVQAVFTLLRTRLAAAAITTTTAGLLGGRDGFGQFFARVPRPLQEREKPLRGDEAFVRALAKGALHAGGAEPGERDGARKQQGRLGRVESRQHLLGRGCRGGGWSVGGSSLNLGQRSRAGSPPAPK